jgi:hypothetical protein
MKCRALAGAIGLLVLAGVLLAAGNRTATIAWADPGTIGWDIYMTHSSAPVLPTLCTSNNPDDVIRPGECPDVTFSFSIASEGGTQSFFDRANAFWSTGELDGYVTPDDVLDATDGLVPNRPEVLGAKVGQVHLQVQSNLIVDALLQNDIDDVAASIDPHVTGQPFSCGDTDTLLLEDDVELWNAITDDSNGIVSAAKTQDPDPYYYLSHSPYRPCDATGILHTPACPPKGVTMLPQSVQELEAVLGVPLSRSYGIARMPIVGGMESKMDVNFLVYRLDDAGMHGYMAVTLVQYPGLRSPDPRARGYHPLAQILKTCPPYETTVTVYGVTSDPDFNEDGLLDLDVSSDPELNRLVVCSGGPCGPYDYTLEASLAADYDGDTIPDYADRCDTDPLSGTPEQDSDGDTLTGPCDSNGEDNNPAAGVWNAKAPWDAGQDIDGDGYLNYADNCPAAPDRDLDGDHVVDYQRDSDGDGVGDLCDPAPTIPGDGKGYRDPSPGWFSDYDDLCNDPWTVGVAELPDDSGRYCLKGDELATDWNDSNDDGTPDYVDLTGVVVGGGVMADCNSDSDSDGLADAVEAAPSDVQPCAPVDLSFGTSSDPLDPWSPTGPAVGGIAEPPDLPVTSAEGTGTSVHGSGWSAGGYAALAGALVATVLATIAGAWYARRRWVK